MLVAVVEQKQIHALLFQLQSLRVAIFAHPKKHFFAKPRMQQRNLIALPCSASVTATQNSHALPLVAKTLCQPEDHRRFTSAADGKIPDADDRSMQMMLLQNSFCVEPYAHLRHDAINHRQRPEQPLHPQGPVHLAAPPSCTAINASARSRDPRLFSTRCRAASPILRIFSGSLKR